MSEILEKERETLQERLSLLLDKLKVIQRGLDLAIDPNEIFKYEKDEEDVSKKIAQLKEQLYGSGIAPESNYAWNKIFDRFQLSSALKALHTVDCNREEHYEKLLRHFEDAVGTKSNLFYLIVACPHQRPKSIAKRLVYEISKDFSIVYNEDAQATEVFVKEMEFSLKSPEHTWNLLWDSMRDNRNVMGRPPGSLNELAAQLAEKDYLALIYRYNAQRWSDKQIEHLRYIAQQFQNLPENNRKFLVCIAIEFWQIHDQNCEKYANNLAQLIDLSREISTNGLLSTCISLLPPVESESIKGWCSGKFHRDGENAALCILEKLQQETKALGRFNMDQIEPMQEAAYQYRNRPRTDLPF